MARMSIEDGLVMQIHPGSYRNHNPSVFGSFGLDKGADIPMRTDYVHDLKPLLDRFGNDGRLSIILVYAGRINIFAGNWRRLPGTIRHSSLVPPGGFTTVRKGCGFTGSTQPKPPAFITQWGLTTTPGHFHPYRRGMTLRGAWTAHF